MSPDDSNPYIALSDLALNLVLVLVFFVAALVVIGRSGWEDVKYKDAQQRVRLAVRDGLPESLRPNNTPKNDPPGAQRWVFTNRQLFLEGQQALSREGRRVLTDFAKILCRHPDWRRIRVEGHTRPPRPGEPDNWLLSAGRAAVVATAFTNDGGVKPYHVAVAGRAGQAPIDKKWPDNPSNERVEIIIEYTTATSSTQPCYK